MIQKFFYINFLFIFAYQIIKNKKMGRKITNLSVKNFYDRKDFSLSNTSVKVCENGYVFLKLFGNVIAGHDYLGTWITDAGWPTKTTIERLNGLRDVKISTKKGHLYLNEEKWDGEKVYIDYNNFNFISIKK